MLIRSWCLNTSSKTPSIYTTKMLNRSIKRSSIYTSKTLNKSIKRRSIYTSKTLNKSIKRPSIYMTKTLNTSSEMPSIYTLAKPWKGFMVRNSTSVREVFLVWTLKPVTKGRVTMPCADCEFFCNCQTRQSSCLSHSLSLVVITKS
jgi:hypothetical protein